MSGVEEPLSIKKEKQDKYSLLIILLVLIGMLIIILFIFMYHRRKLRRKSLKQKVRDVMREKRKRKYMLRKNSIKLINNSSIRLKILGNSDLNNKTEKIDNQIEILDKSKIKNSSTGIFKEDDMILKLTVPKYKLNLIPFDTDNLKTKSNINTSVNNSPRNNISKSIIQFNNSKSLMSINISPTNTLINTNPEDFVRKKTPIEEEINCSVNSSVRKSPVDTEKNSESNLKSHHKDSVIMTEGKACCKEDEELEKIATIKLKEKDLDFSVSSV